MKKLSTILLVTIFAAANIVSVSVRATGDENSASVVSNSNYYMASVIESVIEINGPAAICSNQQGVHYRIDSVPGAISYQWSVPIGATIVSGQGTIAIIVNFGSVMGDVCVTSFDGSVTSSPSCVTTQPAVTPPVMPGFIAGPYSSVCPGHIIEYTCSNDLNASTYTWDFPNCTILSGQGTNQVKVLVGPNFTWAYFRVSASNCRGTSPQKVIAVYSAPGYPGWIMGPQVGACAGSTYTYWITPVQGATSYTWFAPAGAVITSPVLSGNPLTTSVAAVQITMPAGFVEGSIYVCSNSGCNSSLKRKLNIRSVPAYPNWIKGPSYGLCHGNSIVYVEDSVPGATSYTWSIVPSDFTTIHNNGNDSITVDFAPGFTYAHLYVTANNGCGSSFARSLVLNAAPRAPQTLRGPIGACNSNPIFSIAYYETDSVYGTDYYRWVVPAGANIVSGQGTTKMTVDFLGASNGNVAVKAENNCGASSYDTVYVIVNGCRMSSGVISSEQNTSIDFKAYPNPAHEKLKVSFQSSVNEKYSVKLFDITGRLVISEHSETIDGMNGKEFDLSGFAPGMYTLTLEKGEAVERMKVVIE